MRKKILLLLFGLPIIVVGISEFRLWRGSSRDFDFGSQLWIHRGGEPENSIEGIKGALKNGFEGVEIDIFFDTVTDQFIVSHDSPSSSLQLTLESVLAEFKDRPVKFWLDYKNSELKHFFKAKKKLENLISQYGFGGRIFVESPHAVHQLLLSWSGIDASMWVRDFSKSRIQLFRLLLDRWVVGLGNFISVSMPKEAYSRLKKTYQSFDILIFTVNDPHLKQSYSSVPNIKVILTDLNSSNVDI